MRLLLDQNLSFRLVAQLADIFPDAEHVRDIGLGSANDESVWTYAKRHRRVILSKDGDFHQRALLLGPPPKTIWLRLGNCSTREVEKVLRNRRRQIRLFIEDASGAVLVIDPS